MKDNTNSFTEVLTESYQKGFDEGVDHTFEVLEESLKKDWIINILFRLSPRWMVKTIRKQYPHHK
jgi:hypothetical protein